MDKARQALREGAPDIMKDLQPGEADDEDEGDSCSSPKKQPFSASCLSVSTKEERGLVVVE
jgi:hypothetical protein